MSAFRLYLTISLLLFALILTSYDMTAALTDEPGKEASIYSPIIRVEADQGFILIAADSGILWVKATPEAQPHLTKLPVRGLIDLVVEFQGNPIPRSLSHGNWPAAILHVKFLMEKPAC